MSHIRTLVALHQVQDRKSLPTNGIEWYQASVAAPKTLTVKDLCNEKDPHSYLLLTEYHVTISTRAAFTELLKKLPHILCNHTTLNLVNLTIDVNTEREEINIPELIQFFPELKEITFRSNRFISIRSLLEHPNLKKITITNGLMFLAQQEKEGILEKRLHQRKIIILDQFSYQFHSPPSGVFWFSYVFLALLFQHGTYMLAHATDNSQETGTNRRNLRLVISDETASPIFLMAVSTILTIALTLFALNKVHAQNREVIKETVKAQQ